jgi:hypothetical protein
MRPNVNHFTALAVLAALAVASAPVAAQLPAPPGLPAPPPLPDLQVAVHATFGLPEPEIGHLLQGGLPDEDLPVVGFLSVQLGQPVETIVKLHRTGLTFLDIALKFGHGPELFYVPFDADPGPPYGRAWGYYHNTPRARWRTIRLPDVDVVNLVNLRLCSDYYGVRPARIVELRRGGHRFGEIHRTLADETGRHGHGEKGEHGKRHPQKAKGHGKDGGHGHGKGGGHGHGEGGGHGAGG